MTEPDPDTIEKAAREFHVLRQMYWKLLGASLACVAGMAVSTLILKPFNETASLILAVPLALGFVGCILVGGFTWFRLLAFRCPRCSQSFILSWAGSWPESSCKHCGFLLPAPAITSKSEY